jgi:hypothetical protein
MGSATWHQRHSSLACIRGNSKRGDRRVTVDLALQAGPVVRLLGNVVEKDIGGLPCFFPVRIDKQQAVETRE